MRNIPKPPSKINTHQIQNHHNDNQLNPNNSNSSLKRISISTLQNSPHDHLDFFQNSLFSHSIAETLTNKCLSFSPISSNNTDHDPKKQNLYSRQENSQSEGQKNSFNNVISQHNRLELEGLASQPPCKKLKLNDILQGEAELAQNNSKVFCIGQIKLKHGDNNHLHHKNQCYLPVSSSSENMVTTHEKHQRVSTKQEHEQEQEKELELGERISDSQNTSKKTKVSIKKFQKPGKTEESNKGKDSPESIIGFPTTTITTVAASTAGATVRKSPIDDSDDDNDGNGSDGDEDQAIQPGHDKENEDSSLTQTPKPQKLISNENPLFDTKTLEVLHTKIKGINFRKTVNDESHPGSIYQKTQNLPNLLQVVPSSLNNNDTRIIPIQPYFFSSNYQTPKPHFLARQYRAYELQNAPLQNRKKARKIMAVREKFDESIPIWRNLIEALELQDKDEVKKMKKLEGIDELFSEIFGSSND